MIKNQKAQTERVLEYIKEHGTITSMDAFQHLGIVSLHRRLSDLKAQGHTIVAYPQTGTNRYGKKVHYNVYKLSQENKNYV